MQFKPSFVVAGLIAILAVVVGGRFLVDRVADKVIQKLQREYSPSPYGPGFDPDKVDIDRIQKKTMVRDDHPWDR